MRSASEHRPELAEIIFKYEIVDVAQSLVITSDTAYQGKKSDIMKRLPPFSLPYLPNKESNAAIITKMSPVIRAKCASVTSDVDCFSNLAFVIFFHVQSLTSSFDRVDLVFDRYFQQSLTEDTRKGRGVGSRFVFTWNTKLPYKMTEGFLINSANKNDFNKFLDKKFQHLYRGDQIYFLSHRDSVLTNHPEQVSDEGVSIRKCQSGEADRRVIRHTLHCIGQKIYKQSVVWTIGTDVLILLISYFWGVTSCHTSAFNVYAEMINSSIFYDIGKVIAFLGPDIWKALRIYNAFTGCDIISSFYGKGKCKA